MFPRYDNDSASTATPCFGCDEVASLWCASSRPDLLPTIAMCARCAPSHAADCYEFGTASCDRRHAPDGPLVPLFKPIRCERLARDVAQRIKSIGALQSLFYAPTLNEVLCLSLLGPKEFAARESYTYRLCGLMIGDDFVSEDGPLSGYADRSPSSADQLDLLNGVKDCVCAATAWGGSMSIAGRASVDARTSAARRAEHLYAWSRVAYRLAAM